MYRSQFFNTQETSETPETSETSETPEAALITALADAETVVATATETTRETALFTTLTALITAARTRTVTTALLTTLEETEATPVISATEIALLNATIELLRTVRSAMPGEDNQSTTSSENSYSTGYPGIEESVLTENPDQNLEGYEDALRLNPAPG